MNFKRILVPIDFSEISLATVERAVDFAKTFDAQIDLLHSYQSHPGAMAPYGMEYSSDLYENVRLAATEQLQKVCDRVRSAGIETTMHLSQAVPSAAIVEAARHLESDLIIIGTRGLTGLKHVMLGSVAERTVRTAPCPVLTLNHETT